MLLRVLLFAWVACSIANASFRGCSHPPAKDSSDSTFEISVFTNEQGEACSQREFEEVQFFLRGVVDAWLNAETGSMDLSNPYFAVTSLECEDCNRRRDLARKEVEGENEEKENHRDLRRRWAGYKGRFRRGNMNSDNRDAGRRELAAELLPVISAHLTEELQVLVDNPDCNFCLQGNVEVMFSLDE